MKLSAKAYVIALGLVLVLSGVSFQTISKTLAEPVNEAQAGCPAGTYNMGSDKDGEYLCKLQPTGCPYGDSIPLDSPKCAPPENPNAYDRWEPAPTPIQPKAEVKPSCNE